MSLPASSRGLWEKMEGPALKAIVATLSLVSPSCFKCAKLFPTSGPLPVLFPSTETFFHSCLSEGPP